MHKYKHRHRYELKTVHHHGLGKTQFVDHVGETSFVDHVGKNTKFLVEGKKVTTGMPHPSMKHIHCPTPMVREQFEEKGKELEKTDKVTGLWYPHKGKC